MSDEEDMDLEQIDIRALERVSPRTSLMAPEQVQHTMLFSTQLPDGILPSHCPGSMCVLDNYACPAHGVWS